MGRVETLASLLKQHISAKRLRDGQLIHAHICCLGFHRLTFLGNCLIQLYGSCWMLHDLLSVFRSISKPNLHTRNILINLFGQCGRLDDAKQVFDTIPNPDIVSWNTLIAAFTQNECPEMALDLFQQMQVKGVKLNDVTLVCALDACSCLAALEQGKQLHAAIIDSGYEEDVILGTAVLNMYNKCASFDEAKSVFTSIPHTNAVSWNIMILAFIKNGCYNEAKALVDKMQVEGVNPTSVTFVPFVDACVNIIEGYNIHHVIIEHGFNSASGVETALVNLYGKLAALPDAKCVLSKLGKKNVGAWNTAISASSHNGSWEDALDIFQQLCSEGVKPNDVTFLCALNACTQMEELNLAHIIHTYIVYEDFQEDISVNTALVNMYGKCGYLNDARSIFDKIHERNTICWTAMMGACIENGCNEDALELFFRMFINCIHHDSITIGFAIDSCPCFRNSEIQKKIHVTAISDSKHGYAPAIGNALLKMYGKCRNVKDAKAVFDKMQHRTTITWTLMMVVFIQCDQSKEAFQLFQRMQHERIAMDKVAFACALDACSEIVSLKEGHEIEISLHDNGYGEDLMIRSALIRMYGKCGSLFDVERVFESTKSRDVVMWTAVITAFAQNGYSEKVLTLFSAMQKENIKPNEITFLCVLNACSHAGRIDIARYFFTMMDRVYGLCHTIDHYICMVDLLGRAGQLEEAQALIQELSPEEVAGAWMCLLSACKIHSDMDRGQHAASCCIKLDPRNDAPYVVLSNIYADAGQWNDVTFVRESLLLATSDLSETWMTS